MKLVDLHCDTISAIFEKDESLVSNSGQYDIQRAIKANIGCQFFAMFTMPADCNTVLRNTLKQVDKFHFEIEHNSQHLYHLKKYEDINKYENQNKIGCLLHLEGGEAVGTDLEMVSLFYRLGLRSMGLTWNHRNLLADGVTESSCGGGLSNKGKDVISEMNKLGIILDLAHISEACFFDALEYYDKPVIVSHGNVRKLCDHKRNLTIDQLHVLAENNGLIGVTQVSDFVNQNGATIDDFINHIVYIAEVIGVEHVALGSDFDGADSMVINDVEGYQVLPEFLQKRGFNTNEIEMILKDNALRVIKQIL
jgi:membrane dipeptidase